MQRVGVQEFRPMRSVGLGLALFSLACGASPPRDLPIGPAGAEHVLLEVGYRMIWPWNEVRLAGDGTRSFEHFLVRGTCAAIVIPDEHIEIEAGGAIGSSASGASWLVGCASEDGPVQITLRNGLSRSRVVVGLFVGSPDAQAHLLLAEHFHLRLPTAEQPASTLEVHENACEEDEAREHYRRGMELARTDKLEEASEALALAYACHADGTILFNLATVTAQRGRENEAREMFTQLLRDHAGLPESLRTEVESALDQLHSPGTMRIRVMRGDDLFVNGVRVAVTGEIAAVQAVPGRHVVIVRAADGERHELTVQLRSSQEVEIDPRHRVQSTAESE